jgi:uncharacterized protein (TIGR03067 family)
MRTLFCFILVAGLSAADEGKNDAKSDQDKIQGTWVGESAVRNGEALPAKEAKAIKITFKGDKATVQTEEDGMKAEATFTLDPSKKPMEITFSLTDGAKEEKGIYAFDGENLRICAGKERPSEFAVKKGSQGMLVVLKREQSKR